jgi:hypothetical protein
MWCHVCQQDVPGIASAEGQFHCPRCEDALATLAPASQPPFATAIADHGLDLSTRGRKPPQVELLDWESGEVERQLQRRIRPAMATEPAQPLPATLRRFDPPHILLEPVPPPTPPRAAAPVASGRTATGARWSGLAWLATALGLMGFACGGVLLAWSLLAQRGDLWNLGLPITLGGQCGLVIGLLLQLERVWKTSSDNVSKLDRVDERLDDLKQLTTLLGTTQGAGSNAFYTHLSGGASPQLLLADLKGQLDLLAAHMVRR